MTKELIITEKPSAAFRIAESLADSKVETMKTGGVTYYVIKRGNKTITIVPAVGHLFTVAEKKKSFKYPSFDLEWKPVYEASKGAFYAKKYVDLIKQEAQKAKSFVVACDYDIEGEVIGLNVVRFLCGQKDAMRMKFSTLTKPDLVEAYENKSQTIDWGQAKAGETRHFLDWMYGINLSRALTLAIRKSKAYRTMSSGRVQGPALETLEQREKEIQKFKTKKYWEVHLTGQTHKGTVEAWHEKDKFWDEKEAEAVVKKIKGHDGKTTRVERTKAEQSPPNPFDLTTLQTEAYSALGTTPIRTLEYAQELYSRGYISYPRTSSQQLPDKISYKKIIESLSKQANFAKIGKILLEKKFLKPNNGKKTDPAHPAIYPTGLSPSNVHGQALRVYDLIVKRFFATFGENAIRETMTVDIEVNKERFVARGTRTVEKGWHVLYEPYVKLKDEELPDIKQDDSVKVKKVTKDEKETQPPRRYTEASIIKELESRNLGTKATRAQIIENLYEREYITGKSIEVTRLGMKAIETLEEFCPEIVDEELTRSFEEDMDNISEKKTTPEKVLAKAKTELTKTLTHFKQNEVKIGEKLASAYLETEKEKNFIGKCPVCKKGDLQIRTNRKYNSKFIACDAYPKCKTTFPIPKAEVKATEEQCKVCGYPIIEVKNGKIPRKLCINTSCKSKMPEGTEERKEEKEMLKNIVEEECPKCKEGILVVRKSVYGHFMACNKFPKCRFTQPIKDGPLKEDFKK
jgi:DNA topoisomerase I